MKKKELIGVGSLLSAAFLYGFFGILTRTLGFNLPLFYAMWTRSIVCVGILGALLLITKQWKPIKHTDWKWFIPRSCGGLIGYVGSYISFYYIPIGTAYFIFYGAVAIGGYILGSIFFRERASPLRVVSLVLALIGLGFIYTLNVYSGSTIYALFAMASGFGTAIWYTSSKKISGSYAALQLNYTDFLLGLVAYFIMSLILREPWIPISLNTAWLVNLLFVVMFLSTGQLIVYGFQRLDAQIGSLVMLTEVLFGTVLSYLFFHEILTPLTIVGGVFILCAIIIPEIRWKKIKL